MCDCDNLDVILISSDFFTWPITQPLSITHEHLHYTDVDMMLPTKFLPLYFFTNQLVVSSENQCRCLNGHGISDVQRCSSASKKFDFCVSCNSQYHLKDTELIQGLRTHLQRQTLPPRWSLRMVSASFEPLRRTVFRYWWSLIYQRMCFNTWRLSIWNTHRLQLSTE